MKRKNIEGVTGLTIILVLAILVLIVSAASYYILKNAGIAPKITNNNLPFLTQTTPSPTPSEVSNSTDPTTIEEELNQTTVDSQGKDLESLDSSASSL